MWCLLNFKVTTKPRDSNGFKQLAPLKSETVPNLSRFQKVDHVWLSSLEAWSKTLRGLLSAMNFISDLSGNALRPNLTYERWGHFKFQGT